MLALGHSGLEGATGPALLFKRFVLFLSHDRLHGVGRKLKSYLEEGMGSFN